MIIDSPIISGSYAASGSLNQTGDIAITGSLTVTGTIIGAVTGSVDSASFATSASYASISTSSSYSNDATSASHALNADNAISSSHALNADNAISSSFAATSSFADSFTVAGEIVAQTLNVQQVTSSIIYSSGSNVFGNDLSNTQVFTGSLQVTGSNHYMLGNVGIGTDSPAGKLNIAATGADGLVLSPDLSDANNSARIFFTRTGGEGWAIMNNSAILSVRSGAIPGSTSGTQKLGITTDGVATFACQVCIGTSSTVTGNGLLKLGIATGNEGAALQFLGWAPASGYKNWQIDTAYIGNNVLNFTPSTTEGGTTFTTPVLSIDSSGIACFSNTICATQSRISSTGDLSYIYNSGASTTDANFYIYNSTTDILMARNSGCVGIGTANPQRTLDVLTTVNSSTEFQLSLRNGQGSNNVTAGLGFGFNSSGLDPDYLSSITSIITNRTTRAADLTFSTAATGTLEEKARITSAGNLQLGYSGTPASVGKLFISRGDQYGLTINSFSGGTCITSTDDNIYFNFGVNDTLKMFCDYTNCFRGTVCAPLIVANSTSASPAITLANTTGGTKADFTITENTGLIIDSYESTTARSIDLRIVGSSSLFINTNRNVGIGNTSPNNLLEVGNNACCYPSVIVRSQAGYLPTLMLARGDGTFSTTNNSNWVIANSDNGLEVSTINSLDTSAGARCTYLQINCTGNVGIGTSCPQEKFTIDGTSSGAYIRISNASSGDISSGLLIYNGNNLDTSIYTNPTFGNTTFLTRENLAIRAGGSQRVLISCTGITTFSCQVCVGGSIIPLNNGTQDLGSSSLRWCTVYTSDLSLNNGIGNYTIVEGQNDLFIYNNNSCKVYKFLLQEVCPEVAPAKRSI